MESKNIQFKTNLNCGGCVSKVSADLDNAAGICEWSVDTSNSDKILTVKSNGISEEEVIEIVKKRGFIATSHSA
ncbi:heavy-metal-associated domain-containing protein [Sphingobacterium sp. ML3W]|uniref:heavy-metal-associated domain-containing protein n=1 Tax=Sphingobacterium sp. ML3W TaxID=1538644 RepID=UPI00249B016F|nr:heavy-metal-associated domain-containing protein [Sphingobacterium sp. ML3W]WFA80663.1 heavy-metal-associated domain-containing protein [Sphingobacterium sp. ML3W]